MAVASESYESSQLWGKKPSSIFPKMSNLIQTGSSFRKILWITEIYCIVGAFNQIIMLTHHIFPLSCYAFIQPILCFLLMTDILLLSDWKLNIGHLMWQSSKVWFMFQRSNWQHFFRLQAALVRFLTYLKTLGDIYLALNGAGWSRIIYLCLELPLNKEQACFCG